MTVYYEVTIDAEPDLADRFANYMRTRHIPEILATGCFTSIHFDRESTTPTRFRTVYAATDAANLDRYLTQHTRHFRDDVAAHFPAGLTASRATWHEVETWH